MKTVFRHRASGDLYVIEEGELGRIVDLNGERQLVLTWVHRVVDVQTGRPLDGPHGQYQAMTEHHALGLTVSKAVFDAQFEKVEDLKNIHNLPIEQLLDQYEAEGCDFNDLAFVVKTALRFAQSAEDSQARCLLYAMAKKLEPQICKA